MKMKPDNKTELKPCPFCGLKPLPTAILPVTDDNVYWAVYCVGCDAEGPDGEVHWKVKEAKSLKEIKDIHKQISIDLWNTRPESVSKKDIQALIDKWMDEAMETTKASSMYLNEYSIGKSDGYKKCINQLKNLLEPKGE